MAGIIDIFMLLSIFTGLFLTWKILHDPFLFFMLLGEENSGMLVRKMAESINRFAESVNNIKDELNNV